MKKTIEEMKQLFEDSIIVAVEQNNEADEGVIFYVQSNDSSFPMKSITIGFSSCEGSIEVDDATQIPIVKDRVF
jgi:hypothetical protein